MIYNDDFQQRTRNDTNQCPTCGLRVSTLITKCPQDGTFLVAGTMGSFAERYEFIEALGTGGMSIIYKARHRVLNRIVAIKMMHEHMMHEQAIRRFQQEGQAASSLDHPNIVKVHDFGLTDRGQPFMVMDLVEGQSLSHVIEELGELPISQCLIIFIDICEALIHAHEKGILHRDLKPSNIMLTNTLERPTFAKLVDFGIAKILEEDSNSPAMKLTQTGELFGSPPYMSPEQCYGKKLDRRSDIYSLGCLMFECLTGRTPFQGDTLVEILSMHMSTKAPLLHEVRSDKIFPSRLEDLIDRCLAKQPEARFKSVEEIRQQLVLIQLDVDEGIEKDKVSWHQFWRSASKWRFASLLLVTGLLLISLIATGVSNYRLSHSVERKKISLDKAKFLPLFRKDAITTSILSECLAEDAGLRQLDLHDTKVTDDGMVYVNLQNNLRKLNLKNTVITSQGIQSLKDLHNLESLDLTNTRITSDSLAVLKNMPALKRLILRGTKIDERAIPHFSSLKNLEELNLSETNINGPCFGPLTLPNLQILNLSGTLLHADDLSSLHDLPKLKQLALSDSKIENSAIKYLSVLPSLSNLEIQASAFDDNCAKYLAKLSHLKSLDISSTKFSNKGLRELTKGLDLNEIHMRDDEIDQDTIRILKNFHDLHILDIANCFDIDDNIIKEIANIKTVDSLDISLDRDTKPQSRLTPKAIGFLARGMQQLIQLDLSNANVITKDSLNDLTSLKNLRVLTLKGVKVNEDRSQANETLLRMRLPQCEIRQ